MAETSIQPPTAPRAQLDKMGSTGGSKGYFGAVKWSRSSGPENTHLNEKPDQIEKIPPAEQKKKKKLPPTLDNKLSKRYAPHHGLFKVQAGLPLPVVDEDSSSEDDLEDDYFETEIKSAQDLLAQTNLGTVTRITEPRDLFIVGTNNYPNDLFSDGDKVGDWVEPGPEPPALTYDSADETSEETADETELPEINKLSVQRASPAPPGVSVATSVDETFDTSIRESIEVPEEPSIDVSARSVASGLSVPEAQPNVNTKVHMQIPTGDESDEDMMEVEDALAVVKKAGGVEFKNAYTKDTLPFQADKPGECWWEDPVSAFGWPDQEHLPIPDGSTYDIEAPKFVKQIQYNVMYGMKLEPWTKEFEETHYFANDKAHNSTSVERIETGLLESFKNRVAAIDEKGSDILPSPAPLRPVATPILSAFVKSNSTGRQVSGEGVEEEDMTQENAVRVAAQARQWRPEYPKEDWINLDKGLLRRCEEAEENDIKILAEMEERRQIYIALHHSDEPFAVHNREMWATNASARAVTASSNKAPVAESRPEGRRTNSRFATEHDIERVLKESEREAKEKAEKSDRAAQASRDPDKEAIIPPMEPAIELQRLIDAPKLKIGLVNPDVYHFQSTASSEQFL